MNLASVAYFGFMIIKVTLNKTIRNDDFLPNNVALNVDAVKQRRADDFKRSFRAATLKISFKNLQHVTATNCCVENCPRAMLHGVIF